jgi:HSP20 family molecular chaperone IbpA
MALFPRVSSFGPVSAHPFRQEFSPFFNLFNDTFNELQKISSTTERSFTPRFDVKESKDAYTLDGELPGIDQKDITIEFTDEQTLTIKGHSEQFKEVGQPPKAGESAQEKKGKPSEVTTPAKSEVAKDEASQHTYWVSERVVGEFSRSFNFPSRVDHDNIKASLKNGVLTIVVPKLSKPAAGSRRINIE